MIFIRKSYEVLIIFLRKKANLFSHNLDPLLVLDIIFKSIKENGPNNFNSYHKYIYSTIDNYFCFDSYSWKSEIKIHL